ncbi:hypothetical protein K502DRAFT_323463 [Neoconidiobolus thromboides FSU 785]|nr:hypothetical protein K502DRAFT_323463 [Neoconidiobolus thromboides FSU 785]
MFFTLSLFFFIATTLSENPLGLTYLDANCRGLKPNTAWFEVDISPKYQRNCEAIYSSLFTSRARVEAANAWYQGKSCFRPSHDCGTFSRQYCTDAFLAAASDSTALPTLIQHEISSTNKERDYLYFNPPVGTGNYITVDLRQGIKSIIIPMDNVHPDDDSYRQVFEILMTEKIVGRILNNTGIYKKNTQTIQSDTQVLSIDKVCLLANDVLRTASMKYDFSNCFRLNTMTTTKLECAPGGKKREVRRGYYCANSGEKYPASSVASCLYNLNFINASELAYNNKALDYMRTAVIAGISAIPYAGLVLAATTNAILGPTADEMILAEYKDAEYDEKAVILRGVRKQVLKESSELAKGYVKDNWKEISKSIKKLF